MYSNKTRDAYVDLVQETREAFDKVDSEISLSMAVPFTAKPLGQGFKELLSNARLLNFIDFELEYNVGNIIPANELLNSYIFF